MRISLLIPCWPTRPSTLTLPQDSSGRGGKLIEGPVFVKSDSGPGRQCKSYKNIKFRRDMHRIGFHIGPGLPNFTSATQEMDDIFQDFKSKTDQKAQAIFTRKTYEHAMQLRDRAINPEAGVVVVPAHLTNSDLPEMINGRLGEPIEERPFDACFTPKGSWGSWMQIGFVPLTRHALSHKKVRHVLGEGGASDEMKSQLADTESEYNELKSQAKADGINSFVFGSKIPIYKHPTMKETEDEQMEELLDGKSAFSAGGQWCALGFKLMGANAIVGAQVRQLQKEKDGSNETVLKKLRERREKMRSAQGALEVHTSGAELSGNDSADIIKFIWPRYDPKCAPSKLTSNAKRIEKLAEIDTFMVCFCTIAFRRWMMVVKTRSVAQNLERYHSTLNMLYD